MKQVEYISQKTVDFAKKRLANPISKNDLIVCGQLLRDVKNKKYKII